MGQCWEERPLLTCGSSWHKITEIYNTKIVVSESFDLRKMYSPVVEKNRSRFSCLLLAMAATKLSPPPFSTVTLSGEIVGICWKCCCFDLNIFCFLAVFNCLHGTC